MRLQDILRCGQRTLHRRPTPLIPSGGGERGERTGDLNGEADWVVEGAIQFLGPGDVAGGLEERGVPVVEPTNYQPRRFREPSEEKVGKRRIQLSAPLSLWEEAEGTHPLIPSGGGEQAFCAS
jgi:hypothetical protein